MEYFVQAVWAIIATLAFAACLYALNDIGTSDTLEAWLSVFVFALIWLTWRVYHRR